MKKVLFSALLIVLALFAGCFSSSSDKETAKVDAFLNAFTSTEVSVKRAGELVVEGVYAVDKSTGIAVLFDRPVLAEIAAGSEEALYNQLAVVIGDTVNYDCYAVLGNFALTVDEVIEGKMFTEGQDAATVLGEDAVVVEVVSGKTYDIYGNQITEYDYTLELSIANTEVENQVIKNSDSDWEFYANGLLTITYKAKIYDADGELMTGFQGQAQYVGKLEDPDVSQEDASFDNGVATFTVKVPNSEIELFDEVYVKIKNAVGKDSLIGLESNVLDVTYFPYSANTGGETSTTKTYKIDSVKSADTADRVKVYVGQVSEEHVANVMDAIKAQLRLYNNYDSDTEIAVNPIEVVGFSKVVKQNDEGDYVFTALLELPVFDRAGYVYDNSFLLRDNGYNYYSVESPVSSIRLAEEDIEDDGITNKFMLIDSIKPVVSDVFASNDSSAYLGNRKLLAVFGEAVERISAETPANWVLNGHVLLSEDIDTSGIRVLDIYDEEDADGRDIYLQFDAVEDDLYEYYSTVDSEAIGTTKSFNGKDINYVVDGKERSMVVISLTARAARLYLNDGENLLQARSIADWAGVTDKTENNIITTQDFLFEYSQPQVEVGLVLDFDVRDHYRDADGNAMKKESPEQFILKVVGGPLYLDEDANVMLDLTSDTDDGGFELKLSGYVGSFEKGVDYQIRKLADDYYIIEFVEDWTQILGDDVYHGEELTAMLNGVDGDGDTRIDNIFDIYGAPLAKDIEDSVVLEEDVKSPFIDIVDGYKDIEFTAPKTGTVVDDEDHPTGNVNGTYQTAVYTDDYFEGEMTISMDEPCQFLENFDTDADGEADLVVSLVSPGVTPSDKQKDEFGVPVPTFEYVRVSAGSDQPAGYKVDGEFVDTPATEHDWTFSVKPTEDLEPGSWKLVVRSISDDIGNTMATEQIFFEIEEGEKPVIVTVDTVVDPYVVWAYAKDDILDFEEDGITPILDERGEQVKNDFVYILYSRRMEIDVIRAATYIINGKELTEDANITRSNPLVLFRKSLDMLDDDYDNFWGETDTDDNGPNEFWRGELVTIKLPGDFLVGDNMADGNGVTNTVVLPLTLNAINDNVDKTLEALQFGNNDGSNAYELVFDEKENDFGDNYFGVYGIQNYFEVNSNFNEADLVVPPVDYSYNAEYVTAAAHWVSVMYGELDTEALEVVTAEVDALVEADYTVDSWAAFEAAMEIATDVVLQEQQDVIDMVAAIEAALDLLVIYVDPSEMSIVPTIEAGEAVLVFLPMTIDLAVTNADIVTVDVEANGAVVTTVALDAAGEATAEFNVADGTAEMTFVGRDANGLVVEIVTATTSNGWDTATLAKEEIVSVITATATAGEAVLVFLPITLDVAVDDAAAATVDVEANGAAVTTVALDAAGEATAEFNVAAGTTELTLTAKNAAGSIIEVKVIEVM